MFGERRQPERRMFVEQPAELAGAEIEPLRRHGLVRRALRQVALARIARVEPRLVIVAYQLGTLFRRFPYRMIGHDTEALQIVEDRVEVVVEQRQPVFHAGIAPAFGHGRIKGIVAGGGAEQREIVLAEAADRFRRERHLAHRIKVEGAGLADGALAGGIEGANAFQSVAEEIEAHRLFLAGHEDIKNAAAHGELADFPDGGDALEAVALQPRGNIVHLDLVAGPGGKTEALDHLGRGHLLQHGIDRDQHDGGMRLLRVGDKPGQSGQAARRGVGGRRDAVIGQAVPGRKRQHRDLGRGKGQVLLDIGHALAVRQDVGDRLALARQFGQHKGIHAVRHVRQRQRRSGGGDLSGIDERDHSERPDPSIVTGEKSGRQAAMRSNSGVWRWAGTGEAPVMYFTRS